MNDKKDYKTVLKVLNKVASAQTVLNQLTDILHETEDTQLKLLIKNVIDLLRSTAKMTTMKVHLGKIDMIAFPTHRDLPHAIIEAEKYCTACVNAAIPQWQILALRAGWTPPAK